MPENGMRFAFATGATPGDSLAEQCARIASAGCQGIEALVFPDSQLEKWQNEIRQATTNHNLELPVVILGNLALYQPGEMSWVRDALSAIAELGAATLLTPEYRAQDPIPLFPPYPTPSASELDLVRQSLDEISQIATQLEMLVVFEPIHSYMTRFWHNVETPLSICKELNNPHIGLVLDFNVMNMTEASIPDSIRRAGQWVRHIHLADNNRLLPGQGHIDFAAGLNALQAIGYTGWFSFECVASSEERFESETRDAIQYLNRLWLHNVEE